MALTDSTNPMQGVSGPGKFAKRTDLQYQPDAYGDGVEMAAIKAGAPLAKATPTPAATGTEVRQAAEQAPQVVSLFAPSQRPNEPITAGIDMGPGPGSAALAATQPSGKISDTLAALLPYDTTGEITILYQNALSRGQ